MKNLLKMGVALAFLFSGVLSAQQISGNISDETGPLPGATVVVAGTNTGTVAVFDGNYSISASAGDVLVFSFVGFTAQEVTVGNQDFSLKLELSKSQFFIEIFINL